MNGFLFGIVWEHKHTKFVMTSRELVFTLEVFAGMNDTLTERGFAASLRVTCVIWSLTRCRHLTHKHSRSHDWLKLSAPSLAEHSALHLEIEDQHVPSLEKGSTQFSR